MGGDGTVGFLAQAAVEIVFQLCTGIEGGRQVLFQGGDGLLVSALFPAPLLEGLRKLSFQLLEPVLEMLLGWVRTGELGNGGGSGEGLGSLRWMQVEGLEEYAVDEFRPVFAAGFRGSGRDFDKGRQGELGEIRAFVHPQGEGHGGGPHGVEKIGEGGLDPLRIEGTQGLARRVFGSKNGDPVFGQEGMLTCVIPECREDLGCLAEAAGQQ